MAARWTTSHARLYLDPRFYLNPTLTGEAKPLVITDYVSVTSQDVGDEIQLGQGVTLKLAGPAKPKLIRVPCFVDISQCQNYGNVS